VRGSGGELGADSDRWIGLATLPAAAAAAEREREGRRGLMTGRGARAEHKRERRAAPGRGGSESVANRGDQVRPTDPVGHAPGRGVRRVGRDIRAGASRPGWTRPCASPAAASRHRAADSAGRRRAAQGAGWREALLFFQIQNCGGRASDTPALVACCFAPPPTECAYVLPTHARIYALSYARLDFRSLLAFSRCTVLISPCFVF
jgi:hypothetical protein